MSNTVGEPSRDAAVQAVFLDITRTFGISFVPDLFEGMRTRPSPPNKLSAVCKTRHRPAVCLAIGCHYPIKDREDVMAHHVDSGEARGRAS